jgi:hypothetical protein
MSLFRNKTPRFHRHRDLGLGAMGLGAAAVLPRSSTAQEVIERLD